VHLVGFITKKFLTMHGHMNVKFAANEWSPNHIRTSLVYFIWNVIKRRLSKLQKWLRWKRFHIRIQHCRCGYFAVITARQCVLKVSPVCTVAFYCSALNKSVEGLLLQLTFPVSLAMASYRQTFPLVVMNYRIDHIGPTKKGRFCLLTAVSVVHITKVNIFLLWKPELITKNTVYVFIVHNRDSWLYKLL